MMGLPEPILAVVRDHPAVLTCYMCEILRSGLTELGVECIESMAKAVIKDGLSQRALDDQIKRATRRKKAESAGRGRRATREVMTPVLIGDAKHGEFKVMKSRDEGKKLITLTANLPDSLVESFRGDIQAALERLAASA
jgi:hypothetical protein